MRGKHKEISINELMSLPEVIEEVKRHLWIESEKAGYDKGLSWAKEDWLNRYAVNWLAYYKSDFRLKKEVPETPLPEVSKFPAKEEKTVVRKRRAKYYWAL